MVLQPIVENAIRHGLGQSEEAVTVEVTATSSNGSVNLVVCDDGPGLLSPNLAAPESAGRTFEIVWRGSMAKARIWCSSQGPKRCASHDHTADSDRTARGITVRLNVLVVDDEPIARDGLKLLLGRQPQVGSVSEARNGREATAFIREQKPDLVLLDVQMPRVDGFAVVHSVGAERMPPIIFVTAHDKYAIRAFEIAAIDYLLKPVTEERFKLAFKRAMDRLRGAPHEDATKQLLAMLDAVANPPRQLERFAVRSGENTSFVPVNDVDWIEAFQNYVRLHAGPATYLLHVPMNTIEGVLDSNRFLRIHRSHIVNVRRIAQLWSIAHGQYEVELKSGQRLQSGRTYNDRIRRALANPF